MRPLVRPLLVMLLWFGAAALTLADDAPAAGFLGIVTGDAPEGALVSAVLLDSPAAKAGLQANDVVAKVANIAVQGRESMIDTVRTFRPGEKVKLTVVREGAPREVTVTLSSVDMMGPLLVTRHPPRAYGGEFVNSGLHSGDVNLQGSNHVVQGKATIEGDYVQGFGALMACRLDGRQDYSSLKVTGAVKLDGTLYVELGKYEPGAGSSFELIRDAKSIDGRFRHLMLPLLPPELRWEVVYDDLAKKQDYDNDGQCDVTLVIRLPRPGKK